MDANTGYVFSNKEGGKKWNWQSEVDFPRGKSWFDHRLAKPVEIDDQIVAELLPINSHFILDYNYWLNTLIPSICSQYFAQILRAYNSSAPSLNRLEQTHFHDRKYFLDKVFIFLIFLIITIIVITTSITIIIVMITLITIIIIINYVQLKFITSCGPLLIE